MSIPAGHILTVGGLNVIDRLQDAGLQNPKVPTEVVRETGNDLVVGKILTEANFTFQLTSWDVSCDMMAMLTGKLGDIEHGPSEEDAQGTEYNWVDCQFLNLACPWARDTGPEGGDIASGVLIPAYYAKSLSYKFGVTANAEQTVSLDGGAYYQFEGYPVEEFAEPAAKATTVETSEAAAIYRIGGFGSEIARHVFGVLVNGVIQQEGVDYVEEAGTTLAEVEAKAEPKKVKIKFAKEFLGGEIVRFCYFSTKAHALPQEVHASTEVTPAAVRGRNIELLIADTVEHLALEPGEENGPVLLRGVQTFDLNATTSGTVQREMGTQDPIGFSVTGTDCNGTITIDPKEEAALYVALSTMTGISREEIQGYLNEHTIAMKAVIRNPKNPSEIIKSIHVGDAKFQIPGTTAKVNTTLSLPITFESELGTFTEVKGE